MKSAHRQARMIGGKRKGRTQGAGYSRQKEHQENSMQRDSKSAWRPRTGIAGAVTAVVVVGLSAFVQARLLWAEPEVRKIFIASHASPRVGCVETSTPVRVVDVLATTPAPPLPVVERPS
jgi:hypothetical protein